MHRGALLAVLIALATAGCFGSSAGSTSGPSSDSNLAYPWPKTALSVVYYARRCPPGARCPGRILGMRNVHFYRVTRTLRCDPDGGDYTDPTAACDALRRIVAKLATKDWVCGCALAAHPPEHAVGVYQGKRRTIPLDGCSLCNLGGIQADLALLLPGGS